MWLLLFRIPSKRTVHAPFSITSTLAVDLGGMFHAKEISVEGGGRNLTSTSGMMIITLFGLVLGFGYWLYKYPALRVLHKDFFHGFPCPPCVVRYRNPQPPRLVLPSLLSLWHDISYFVGHCV